MKNSTLVLCAILCAGFANSSHAQDAQPTTYETALAAGQRDFKSEKYEAATKDVAESLAVAASPEETGEALTLLGESYYRRKMYDEAQQQWTKILALPDNDDESSHAFAHFGFARSYDAQGQFDKAIPEYKTFIESLKTQITDANTAEGKQTLAPFNFALANAYAATKQYDLAQQELKQITEYSKGDSGYRLLALIKRGEVDMNQRDFKGALDSFNQVLALADAQTPTQNMKTGQIGGLIQLLQGLVKSEVGMGQANDGKPEVTVVPPPKIAETLNTINQSYLDSFITAVLTDPDEE